MNVLNFERFKWGGVRHADPLYATLDLEQFAKLKVDQPTEADISIMREIIDLIDNMPDDVSAARASKYLKCSLKSNEQERAVLLEILAYCDILETSDHRGYLNSFNSYSDRTSPPHRFVDREYPFCWWRASDGRNKAATKRLFGHVL